MFTSPSIKPLTDLTRQRLILCILIVMLTPACVAEVRAMAINAEWLWTPSDKQVDGQKHNKGDPTPAAYNTEMAFYTKLILDADVDIVSLAEIENETVVIELVALLGEPWRGYFKQGRDTATGQDVALLSRLSYIEGSLTDFGFPSGKLPGSHKKKRLSKIVGARFRVQGKQGETSLGVITSHFLSKRNDSSKKARNRQKQAFALVKASKRFSAKNDKLILLGDFNDYLGSPVISVLLSGAYLKPAGQHCKQGINKLGSSRSLDHILYRGLRCIDYKRLDLKQFSDHDAIYSAFTL